ncbi:MAG: type II CRISPR RNA-guided endonuclease Cas9, partial [Anaerovoracaceae bacterium]
MSYIFGLDIGIASVGWAVVDENYEVIESGSNLFSAAEASSNVERRGFRQGKRLKRRQKTRIGDFIKLWKNQGLAQPKETCNEVLELRNKGLSEKLTEEEIFTVLLNMLKHRGISYLEDALEDGSTGGSNYERAIAINQEELKKKLPCQIQYERLQKYGHYRGDVNVTDDNGEKITLSNVFTTGAYKNELKQFFKVQKNYHSILSDKFEEDYMKIFSRKREYYEGPGNELSRTDYGKYTTKINPETGEYITEENIFEKLIGRCSVYKDQLRAAAATYTAQEFNALNDLNNLVINERKLTEEEKREIIEKIKTTAPTDKGMAKLISKVIKEEIESISGARIDKSENDIFHRFEQYNKMRKELEKINVDICVFSREELDELGYILTINTEREAIVKAVMNSNVLDLSEETLDCFISLRKKNGSLFNKWHSFSVKIMEELIPVLYEQPKNQMQILTEMGVFKSKGEI